MSEPTHTPDPQITIDAATKLFERHLTSEWTLQKLPYGLVSSFKGTNSASEEDTSQIFLDASLNVWVSHLRAKQSKHYPGQKQDTQTLLDFDKLPREDRKAVALVLASIQLHPTVQSAIEKIELALRKHRCRDSTERPGVSSSSALSTMQPVGEGQSVPTAGPVDDTTAHTTNTTRLYDAFDTPYPAVTPFEQVLSNPRATRLTSVFPQYLCSGIKKTDGRAAVSLNFIAAFTEGLIIYSMSLEILPSKVQHLALKLFGTHVEMEEGVRSILQANGSRLYPQNVTLQGGQGEAISELLGPWVQRAIEECPLRVLEIQDGKDVTVCVRLQITGSGNENAHLSVSMGFEGAFKIKDALFPYDRT